MKYPRLLKRPLKNKKSFFLFGPRGTGKTSWLKGNVQNSIYLDLLRHDLYLTLLRDPGRLVSYIPKDYKGWIVLDEVQKVPLILEEVHRLIESGFKFVLTGSNTRKLRRGGFNLLAGRAHVYHMHPFIQQELGEDFVLRKALKYGLIPGAVDDESPDAYLQSYVYTYLREEVMEEGLIRNLSAFSRFLEVASFSQAQALNMLAIAREAQIPVKTVSNYFDLLEDLLLAYRLPVFSKRAKRQLVHHPKFFFFDVGVFNSLRPRGPMDSLMEIEGAGLETLFLQSFKGVNDLYGLGYNIFYWRTRSGEEVDFILYGERGVKAFEIKRTQNVSRHDGKGLLAFLQDYPMAELFLLYGGRDEQFFEKIHVIPFEQALRELPELIS